MLCYMVDTSMATVVFKAIYPLVMTNIAMV
jgi:hypothetical protein